MAAAPRSSSALQAASADSARVPRRDFLGRTLGALAAFGLLGRARRAEAETLGGVSPILGEVRMFAGNFPPSGWALCNGQLLSIASNTALFSLLGTTYGGNGVNTFALPNLQSRVPLHPGQGLGLSPRVRGESAGEETHVLTVLEIPSHTHQALASATNGNGDSPASRVWARDVAGVPAYASSADVDMASGAIASTGGGQPHNNLQPYLTVNFIIAMQGIFPQHP